MSDLLSKLSALGSELPLSSKPTGSNLTDIVAGLVYYSETGSLDAPVSEAPAASDTSVSNTEAEQAARIAELEAAIAASKAETSSPTPPAAGTGSPLPTPPVPAAPASELPPTS